MAGCRIAIIIPAFNEANTIFDVVTKSKNYGTPVVVDDCSTDSTSEIAAQAGAIVISHEFNRGYDEALNTGFKIASDKEFDVVITMDADGQHNPELLKKFISAIDGGADIVAGVRHKKARFAEKVFSYLSIILYGIKDPLCGLKAYRMNVYESKGCFDSYGSIGTDLIIYAAKNNYNISQIEFEVMERFDSPRFGRRIDANVKIFRALILSFLNGNKTNG